MPVAQWRKCAAGASRSNSNAVNAAQDAKRVGGVHRQQHDFEDSGRMSANEAAQAARKQKKADKKAASLQFMSTMESAYDDEGNPLPEEEKAAANPAAAADPAAAAVANKADGGAAATTGAAADPEEQFDLWLDQQVASRVLSQPLADQLTDAIAENRVSVQQARAPPRRLAASRAERAQLGPPARVRRLAARPSPLHPLRPTRQCLAACPVHVAAGFKVATPANIRSTVTILSRRGQFRSVKGDGGNMGV